MDEPENKEKELTLVRRILKDRLSLYCILVGLFWLLFLIIDFIGGYRGFHLVFGLFPIFAVPILMAFIFTLIVIIRSIWSIIRLRSVIKSLVLIIVTIAFWFMPALCPQRPYLLGFKYRVLKLSSPQELREIAAKARILLSEQKELSGPGRGGSQNKEIDAELWEKMPKSRLLDSVYSSVVISVSDDNSVGLSWGCGLTGGWGVRITETPIVRDKYDYEFIPIEEDIAVYMTN